ncbi:hypothetical protein BDQ12DRAFT_636084 [Crucibulum laeve]|uniref:Uncharacterized protein n=1 Tax=Crucibulum laeve TaxID=68775 RepID=A0A5C3LP03_9AGAR|nr:hypothetical protein BDQ12DRAFT_636084 [Crucibulum laeve]
MSQQRRRPLPARCMSLDYDSDSDSDSDSEDEMLMKFALRDYIAGARLPEFVQVSGHNLGSAAELKNLAWAFNWPEYPTLRRELGTRTLKKVGRVDTKQIMATARSYLDKFDFLFIHNETGVDAEESQRLRLPCDGLIEYDKEDYELLKNLRHEEDLLMVLKDYVLGTVSEAVRVMQCLPLDAPLSKTLLFKSRNEFCSAHRARWEILALPSDSFNDAPVIVVFVPPTMFGVYDFAQFANIQEFNNHDLDTLDSKEFRASDILWAVIHDCCKGRGYKFVLTNYLYWAFGTFSNDYTEAIVTDAIESRISSFNGIQIRGYDSKINAIELLAYWMQAARGMIPAAL